MLDLAWSPCGHYVAVALSGGTAIVWNINTTKLEGRLVEGEKGHSGRVQGIAWHPFGDYVCTLSEDRSLRVWEPATNRQGAWRQKHAFVNSQADVSTIPRGGRDEARKLFIGESAYPHFYRRPAWAPDGSFLCAPSGRWWRPSSGSDEPMASELNDQELLPHAPTSVMLGGEPPNDVSFGSHVTNSTNYLTANSTDGAKSHSHSMSNIPTSSAHSFNHVISSSRSNNQVEEKFVEQNFRVFSEMR